MIYDFPIFLDEFESKGSNKISYTPGLSIVNANLPFPSEIRLCLKDGIKTSVPLIDSPVL